MYCTSYLPLNPKKFDDHMLYDVGCNVYLDNCLLYDLYQNSVRNQITTILDRLNIEWKKQRFDSISLKNRMATIYHNLDNIEFWFNDMSSYNHSDWTGLIDELEDFLRSNIR